MDCPGPGFEAGYGRLRSCHVMSEFKVVEFCNCFL